MADDLRDTSAQLRGFLVGNQTEAVERILSANPELKSRINEPIGPFESPAVVSAKSREMLDVLLAAGADLDAKSRWWAGGFGLLHTADPELARYAIEKGATVDVHAASRLGMLETLDSLLSSEPGLVHARGGDGQTPLHFAANVKVAKLLLERGADIDATDIDHQSTPAQYMARSRQEVARFLVGQGCKTDVLMSAALGDVERVRAILDRDPLSVYCRVSDEYFPMIGSKTGGTIYQWELGWYVSAHQVARNLGHEVVFDLLWDRSPDNLKLTTACWLRDSAAVDAFNSSVEEMPAAELRQVAHAARNNELGVVRLMLRAGLPASARSQHNGTALHWACWHGNVAMVNLLLDHGASLNDQENDYHSTPYGWAVHASEHGWNPEQGDYPATIKVLLDRGAKG